MGILDDAIREHLELKRKHGLSEDEVERQQEEALGPARRDVAQQPEDAEIAAGDAEATEATEAPPTADAPFADETAIAPPPLADSHALDHEPETAIALPPEEHAPQPSEPAPAPAGHAAADEPFFEGDEPFSEAGEPFAGAPAEAPPAEPPVADHTGMEPPPDDDEDELEPEPDPGARLGDTEPHGFPAADEDEAAEEEDVEDVLEDTPDFLQETPEHDRLWFEQKPPRDFDFD
jgi:hypothetical protein